MRSSTHLRVPDQAIRSGRFSIIWDAYHGNGDWLSCENLSRMEVQSSDRDGIGTKKTVDSRVGLETFLVT